VARDRQRAKRRKEKRQPSPPAREQGNGGVPDPRAIHRENVPGPVEHTGDVDQFEAELVAGADGEAQADDELVERAAQEADAEAAFGREPAAGEPEDAFGREPDREEPPAAAAGAAAATPAVRGAAAPTQDVHGRGAGRFVNFLRASWAELQRVQWPDRRQVGQATAVVLGFVIVAGAFLGGADWVATQLVDLVI
jgi:preprotein translocase SecE subunit